MMMNIIRRLLNNIIGLNTITARVDILQSKLDEIVTSLDDVNASIKNIKNDAKILPLSANFACSNYTIVDSLNQISFELDRDKKFAFLIGEPAMLVHYADVWKAMGPSNFTIVLTEHFSFDINGNEKLGVSEFFNQVRKEGYEVRKITEIINCGIKFEYVVTNHPISGSTKDVKQAIADDHLMRLINRGLSLKCKDPIWEFGVDIHTYLPLQVGNKQIRYMYGADISEGWSLQSWNNIYDVFLCHGINDEREIKKRFKGKTFIMGYPRYDRFFSERMDLSNIRCEFRVSESKKTVLWMPTLGGDYSSIPLFAAPLSTMCEKYNIIVRPHPLSFYQEKDYIALLEKLNFNIDRNALRDMNELFAVADVILVDNGGTPFSAIFLGKNIIFLDVPDDLGAESEASAHIVGSSVQELKKHLPTINHQDIHLLDKMLDSDEFYIENNKKIDALFKKYFDSPRGGGAKRVVDIFKNL
jgi:hypothetical protein